jgi:hypothetical protein
MLTNCNRSPALEHTAAPGGAPAPPSPSAAAAAAAPGQQQPAAPPELIRVPKSIHEVDNGKILGFGADLAEDHPGFGDAAYTRRRTAIADLARRHNM